MKNKLILVVIALLVVFVAAYAVWYSFERHVKLAEAQTCDEQLAHPPKPVMVTGPDGNPAPLYAINGCVTVVVPPSLWDLVRGRMVFASVPQRMNVNPYSFADILLGRYTFGPADTACDQSATTTSCATLTPATPSNQYATAILACYPKSTTGTEDMPIANNSIQYATETTRMFINMPKDLYPKEFPDSWTTVSGNAAALYISNGGLPGEGLDATPECWSTYFEFDGSGEVDLRAKSTVEGAPDYFVRFIVTKNPR